ncbi:MAG: hypothetical protein ABIP39_07530 [Polyangiaceae bacterium]
MRTCEKTSSSFARCDTARKKALEGPEAETLRQAERAAKAGQSKVTKKSN